MIAIMKSGRVIQAATTGVAIVVSLSSCVIDEQNAQSPPQALSAESLPVEYTASEPEAPDAHVSERPTRGPSSTTHSEPRSPASDIVTPDEAATEHTVANGVSGSVTDDAAGVTVCNQLIELVFDTDISADDLVEGLMSIANLTLESSEPAIIYDGALLADSLRAGDAYMISDRAMGLLDTCDLYGYLGAPAAAEAMNQNVEGTQDAYPPPSPPDVPVYRGNDSDMDGVVDRWDHDPYENLYQ